MSNSTIAKLQSICLNIINKLLIQILSKFQFKTHDFKHFYHYILKNQKETYR